MFNLRETRAAIFGEETSTQETDHRRSGIEPEDASVPAGSAGSGGGNGQHNEGQEGTGTGVEMFETDGLVVGQERPRESVG